MSDDATYDAVDSTWVQNLNRYRPEYLRLTQVASRLAAGEGMSTGVTSELHAVCEALVGAADAGILDGRSALLDAVDGADVRAVRIAIEDVRDACLRA